MKMIRPDLADAMRDPRSRVRRFIQRMRHAADLRSARKHRSIIEAAKPDLRAYCMFIGYPRSGHSLTGTLLNAHPNMVIAHELDALRYVEMGLGMRDLCGLIFDRDRQFADRSRQWYEYDYNVPNQWQGRFDTLQIIGDKKGGASTDHLRERPWLLDRLRQILDVELRMVHIVRNPFDNISTSHRRTGFPLEVSIESYFRRCATNETVLWQLDESERMTLKHEQIVLNPARQLTRLCEFLGIDAPEDYLHDCTSIMFDTPRQTRRRAPWTDELIDEVHRRIDRFWFLDGYRFENEAIADATVGEIPRLRQAA